MIAVRRRGGGPMVVSMAPFLRRLVCVMIALAAGSPAAGQFLGDALRDTIRLTDPSPDDRLYPVSINGRWGHMNQHGALVVYPRFDWTDYSYQGFSRVVTDGRTGFIVGSGDWRIAPRYVYADRFVQGYAVVGDGEHFGYIDRSGDPLVPMRLDGALRFSDGLAAVRVDGRVGFINVKGEAAIRPQFALARSFHDGLAMVRFFDRDGSPGRLGYIDKTGEAVFIDRAGRFAELGGFEDGMARARVGERWGYIDRTFRFSIKPRFDDARDFAGGMAAVKVRGRWGYVNKTGELVIEPRFDAAYDFDQTLAMVVIDGRFGYVGRTGRLEVPPRFDWAEPFFRDYARVSWGDGFGYIDVAGNVIWDPRRALRGFVDLRVTERGALRAREFNRFNQIVPPPDPAPRDDEARPAPYPPEYRYEDVLPRPPAR